jgi:hypothetical protein
MFFSDRFVPEATLEAGERHGAHQFAAPAYGTSRRLKRLFIIFPPSMKDCLGGVPLVGARQGRQLRLDDALLMQRLKFPRADAQFAEHGSVIGTQRGRCAAWAGVTTRQAETAA